MKKVSIITTTYNDSAALRKTIKQVEAQDYPNIEYIIVDGGSEDDTMEVIKEAEAIFGEKLVWISEKDKGIYDAINKGLKLAPGTANGVVLYENIKSKGIRGVNFVSPNGDVVEICYDNARSYAGKSGLLGWDHLAIRTKDIKESMAFYAGLGFAMTGNGYLDTDEGRLYIAFMTCKGFTVELIQLVGAAVEDPDTWKT